jgi:hypothetical protein
LPAIRARSKVSSSSSDSIWNGVYACLYVSVRREWGVLKVVLNSDKGPDLDYCNTCHTSLIVIRRKIVFLFANKSVRRIPHCKIINCFSHPGQTISMTNYFSLQHTLDRP